jgi:Uma2 family endonuclease
VSNKRKGKSEKSTEGILKESGLSYDDYAAIDDGNRYELVSGQLELMSPAPSVIHQLVSFEMQKTISRSSESNYIILHAPVDLILSSKEVRQPDIILIHRSRIDILSKRGVIGAPDLVVEILSPSTLKRDKIDKLKTYAHFGIPEYWVIEPETGVLEQYALGDARFELTNIYQEKEQVTSLNITCASFTMAEIMENIPHLS